MDKPTRPTNYDEIIPWLQARCEGVQREPEHDAHVLLGAASVIIADLHSELARLTPKAAVLPAALDVLYRCAELLDDYQDVNDGDDGQPVPNRAMSLLQDVEPLIAKVEAVR